MFEVGQKVQYGGEDVTVTYGPYTSVLGFARYVVRLERGAEANVRDVQLSAIPEPPKFAVGDKVTTVNGATGELAAGPFRSRYAGGATFWVLADEGGDHLTPFETSLTKVDEPDPVKVGDRVRIVRAKWAEECHGKTGVVTSTSGTWRDDREDIHPYYVRLDGSDGEIHVAEVERVEDANTYTHDGVTYDLTAGYTDRDGDVWKIRRHPELRGATQAQMAPVYESEWGNYSIATLVTKYGPLTRVDA